MAGLNATSASCGASGASLHRFPAWLSIGYVGCNPGIWFGRFDLHLVLAQKAFEYFLRGGEPASELVVEALAFGQLLLKRLPRLLGNAASSISSIWLALLAAITDASPRF